MKPQEIVEALQEARATVEAINAFLGRILDDRVLPSPEKQTPKDTLGRLLQLDRLD